jgi:hypothetical protein
MKRALLSLLLITLGGAALAPAKSFTFTNDPTLFGGTIDWCQLGGCAGSSLEVATPTQWDSTTGRPMSGEVGGFYTVDPLLALQQGDTWGGSFNDGMGVLWNYPYTASGNDIAITFARGVYGAGAYVEPDFSGPYSASIYLFNQVHNVIASYTWYDNSVYSPGTALFIGAFSPNQDVYGAVFELYDQSGNIDFAIGQASFQATPEPATALLVCVSLIGLGFATRRKKLG